jgi:hypothetical protein
MGVHRNRSRVEAISRKITPIDSVIMNDDKGEYVGMCNFYCHPGIVGVVKAKDCEEKMCKNYEKFYRR